jgi:Flp pilus assembly protein TadG
MKRRGSTLVESTLVTTTFLLLMVGIADFGRLGFAYNSITFAAHRGVRYAATRGSGSGHPVSQSDIQSDVQANLAALDNSALTTAVTWTPNNHPGSKVQVQVTYNFKPMLIPLSSTTLSLKSTATQIIVQ